MAIYNKKYENDKVYLLKQQLLNSERNGSPMDYEIRADDYKIVPRTHDISQFDLLEEAVSSDTKAITITLYEGQGHKCDKHIFYLQEGQFRDNGASPALSGLDVEKKVNEKMEAFKKQVAYEKLEEQNLETTNKLKEAEEYIEELQDKVEKLHEELILEERKKLQLNGIHLGEIVSVAGESLIRRNPQWLKRLPGGEMLAGIISEDTQEKEEQEGSGQTTESSFTEVVELTEEEEEKIGALRELQSKLNEEQFDQFFVLARLFMKQPKIVVPTLNFAVKLKEKMDVSNSEQAQQPAPEKSKAETDKAEQGNKKAEETNNREKNIPGSEDTGDFPEIRDAA